MSEEKKGLEPNDMELINRHISTELVTLSNTFGNLLVHLSGEAKLDFRIEHNVGPWLGMIKNIISGDIGCMRPMKGYDQSAFDLAIDLLLNVQNAPHLNLPDNEKYVVSAEKWREFIMSIKEDRSFVSHDEVRYMYELKVGDVVVTRIKFEPLVNTFVVGEFRAAQRLDFVGEISDYDQNRINSAWVVVNGEEIDVDLSRLIHYRHRKYQPGKGDYLLYDREKDYYVLLPREDYSIH